MYLVHIINNMKHILSLIIGLAIAILLTSCVGMRDTTKKKEKAKKKIERIIAKYPELRKTKDTTIIKYDTLIQDKIVEYRDTIVTDKIVIDSNFYYVMDSVYRIQQGNIEALFEFTKNKQFNFKIIKEPEIFYIHDTIHYKDTIVSKNVTVKQTDVINTTGSFWYNLWRTIKGWIWWILIVISILYVIRLILKFK